MLHVPTASNKFAGTTSIRRVSRLATVRAGSPAIAGRTAMGAAVTPPAAPADLRGRLVIGLGDDVCGFRLFPPPGFAA
jgi:hypothetical protein